MKLWPIALLLLISVAAIPAAADSTDTWNFATTHNQSLGTTPIAVMELASLRLATTNSREASAAPARPASVWPAATATTRSTRPLHHSQPQQPVSKSVTGVSLMGSIQRSETGQVCDAFDSCVTFGSGSDSNSVSIFGLFTDIKNHHSGFLTISSGNWRGLDQSATSHAVRRSRAQRLILTGTRLVGLAGMVRRKLGALALALP